MEDAKVNLAKLLWKPLNQLGGHDNTVTNSLSNAAVSNTERGERKCAPQFVTWFKFTNHISGILTA